MAKLANSGQNLGAEGKKLQDKIDILGRTIEKLQKEAKDLLKAEKEYLAEH